MKKRPLVILIVALLGLVLVTWRWKNNDQRREQQANSSSVPAASASPVKPPSESVAASPPPAPPTKGEQIYSVLQNLNHKDIEFYGQVVDQYGSSIPDVAVTGSVIYNSATSSGVQEAHTTTDAQGLFSFKGMKGRTFDYHLGKVGYQTMPEGDAFDYTELVPEAKRHHPDPENPVVLKMWKLQGAEPLVHFYDRSFSLPADGALVRIDLNTGKQVTSGGDIVFRINHAVLPHGAIPELRFEWHAQIEVLGGGLIESDQRLMYLAPDTGYVPTLAIDMPVGKAEWHSTIDQNFYVNVRGNLFGRIQMHLNANERGYDPSHVTLRWWLNPKLGSRNLEVDTGQVAQAAPGKR